jgi:HAD superfamily hydrolase (TIGR01509 family)
MIRNIIFDAGDVLFTSMEPSLRRLERTLEKLDIYIPRQELAPTWKRFRDKAEMGKIDIYVALEQFFKHQRLGKLAKKAVAHYKRLETHRMYKVTPGVKKTLRKLAKNHKLGVLTDSVYSARNRRALYTRMGFNHHISYVASSHDIGAMKPDPRAYRKILKMMSATRRNSVFVGHARDELDGAKRVGLLTIGFNLDRDAKADHVAKRFSDIPKILKKLNAETKK